jgi:signal transduction histidine kinase
MSDCELGTGRPVVLVVDDEEWMRDACGIILGREGLNVLTAADARAGIDIVASHKPDLVLIDVRMPGMSGIDFFRRVKELDPDIVGIVITGYATIDVAVQAMKAGAYEFLPKPFEPDELRGVVQRGLEHRRLLRGTEILGPEVSCMRGVQMAVLAHQLKSPLASLRQCASVVLHGYTGDIPDKTRGMIEVVARRADQMLCLLDDWITLVRLEEGNGLAKSERVDMDALLARLIETTNKGPETSAISLCLDRSVSGAVVQGDPAALNELFANLVTNAIRYTPAGGEVRIAIESDPAQVTVRVSDNGPGIPAEEREKVFEPFYRGKAQRSIPGDGLGLPIARRIARAHGGELALHSVIGQGTVFMIVLPSAAPAAEIRRGTEG